MSDLKAGDQVVLTGTVTVSSLGRDGLVNIEWANGEGGIYTKEAVRSWNE